MRHMGFAVSAPPSELTAVHGYDTTRYNANNHSIDVYDVDGNTLDGLMLVVQLTIDRCLWYT